MSLLVLNAPSNWTSAAPPFTLVTCPACNAEMRVPARFANFILLEQLGRGGMGALNKSND